MKLAAVRERHFNAFVRGSSITRDVFSQGGLWNLYMSSWSRQPLVESVKWRISGIVILKASVITLWNLKKIYWGRELLSLKPLDYTPIPKGNGPSHKSILRTGNTLIPRLPGPVPLCLWLLFHILKYQLQYVDSPSKQIKSTITTVRVQHSSDHDPSISCMHLHQHCGVSRSTLQPSLTQNNHTFSK